MHRSTSRRDADLTDGYVSRMRRIASFLLVLLGAVPLAAQTAAPSACRAGPVALVLSGGGAKGIAHVGVIKALERAGIRPDLIVGTSMGALIGAVYASGFSAQDVETFTREVARRTVFRNEELRGPTAWGNLLPLAMWEESRHGLSLVNAAVRQTEINGVLNAGLLRGNLLAGGRFDRLPIPLRVVATDLKDRSVVVLDGGDLPQAVRASIAIPLVFAPEQVGDRILTDGGLSANIPVAVAREQGARRVLVSDVTERPADTLNLESPLVIADRLLNWLFRQPPDSLGAGDLMVRSPVEGFRALDFSTPALDSLIRLGERTADSVLAQWPCRPARTASAAPQSPAPPRRVLGVVDAADDPTGTELVRRRLALLPGRFLDTGELEERLLRLADREVFRELWLAPTRHGDSVRFHPVLRRLPRRVTGLGLAYDTELGGRVWGGLLDRDLPVVHAEGAAVLALGRFRRDLELSLRRQTLLGRADFSPVATLRLASEDLRRFDAGGIELEAADYRDATVTAGVERYLGRDVRLALLGETRWWREEDLVGARDRHAAGARLLVEKIGGDRDRLARLQVAHTGIYSLAHADVRFRGSIGPYRIEHRIRIGAGDALPPALTFALGGDDGFPGLHLGERRGDREVFTSLSLSRRIAGPIRLRVQGAFGRTAFGDLPPTFLPAARTAGDGLFAKGGWIAGARVGLGSDTPLGPVRVEYGWNDQGREALFLRVGRWF